MTAIFGRPNIFPHPPSRVLNFPYGGLTPLIPSLAHLSLSHASLLLRYKFVKEPPPMASRRFESSSPLWQFIAQNLYEQVSVLFQQTVQLFQPSPLFFCQTIRLTLHRFPQVFTGGQDDMGFYRFAPFPFSHPVQPP